MEYVPKITTFCLKMMAKSNCFEIPQGALLFSQYIIKVKIFAQKYKFSNKNDNLCA